MTSGESYFMDLIKSGVLLIDAGGAIWRQGIWHGRSGQIIDLEDPRRAEQPTPGRYLRLRSMGRGKKYNAQAHRVVYIYFFGDIPEGKEVNHKDLNKCNNRPDNLELMTRKQNAEHARVNGRYNVPHHIVNKYDRSGDRHPMSKLDWDKVSKIRELWALGEMSQQRISEKFGVTRSCVAMITQGRSWK